MSVWHRIRLGACLYSLVLMAASTGCVPGWEQALEEPAPPPPQPTANIKVYEKELEERLHDRYNNLPKYAGKIAYVDVVVAKAPVWSVDKIESKVEFTQLVYDKWGERVPALEDEYFVVEFGRGRPRITRSEPSINVGLNQGDGFYSEGDSRARPDTGVLGRAIRTDGPAPVKRIPRTREIYESTQAMPQTHRDTPIREEGAMTYEDMEPSHTADGVPVIPAAPEAAMPTTVPPEGRSDPRHPMEVEGMGPPPGYIPRGE